MALILTKRGKMRREIGRKVNDLAVSLAPGYEVSDDLRKYIEMYGYDYFAYSVDSIIDPEIRPP